MEQRLIKCPKCGHEFEISKALTEQIRDNLKVELLKEIQEREAKVKKDREDLKNERDEIQKSRDAMDQEVEKRLKDRISEIEAKTTKKLQDEYTEQINELYDTVKDKDAKLKTFREQEMELRKKQRELEEKQQEMELEVSRKIDAEREKIKSETSKTAEEQHRLKDLEKDKLINDLRTALEDMKRKAEQGSMETQGEVLEQDFESQLRSIFPHDTIEPVPKGIRGADLIQIVKNQTGTECGTLLWEMKNTKTWSSQWIPKLKQDMIETRAMIAILVSVSLPEQIDRFGQLDGVWVSDPLSAIPLAAALREQLIAIQRERTASSGKNEKMEVLYQYLAGVEFKQKIEGIVEAFTSMQDQLNQERRAMEKHWKQREKQIERVVKNTVGLYGDMQGIIGGQIPVIPALELEGDQNQRLLNGDDSDS